MLQQAELGGCKRPVTGCAIDLCTDMLNLLKHVEHCMAYVGTVVSAVEGAGLRRGMLKVLEILLIRDLGIEANLAQLDPMVSQSTCCSHMNTTEVGSQHVRPKYPRKPSSCFPAHLFSTVLGIASFQPATGTDASCACKCQLKYAC